MKVQLGIVCVGLVFALGCPDGAVGLEGEPADNQDAGGGNGNDSTHTCAKTQTPGTPARLYCWGANAFGQLGIGRLSDDPVPLPTRVY